MSKRSSRRLAVVAGAALALGSMAPALAVRVDANGDTDASVDLSGLALPSAGSLIPGALITDLTGTASGTVEDVQGLALSTAGGLQGDVEALVAGLLGAASGLSVDIDANANANGGGATVDISGVGNAGGILGAVPAPGDVVGGALGLATPVAGLGLGLADTAVDVAGDAPGLVLGTAGGLLGTGLGLIDGASVSGDVNVIASLLGTF